MITDGLYLLRSRDLMNFYTSGRSYTFWRKICQEMGFISPLGNVKSTKTNILGLVREVERALAGMDFYKQIFGERLGYRGWFKQRR